MMRRLLTFVLIIAAAGCKGDELLAPVQTIDGVWSGTQNGFALTLAMTQSGTTVSGCNVRIGSNGGFVEGTCVGTFTYPTLKVKISVNGFQSLDYDATMSQNEAKLFGTLNGSGLDHVEVDIRKQ
jgi:hypothetical protein